MKPHVTKHTLLRGNCRKGKAKKAASRSARRVRKPDPGREATVESPFWQDHMCMTCS